jgi:periplasmic divalent cation tolerance protein
MAARPNPLHADLAPSAVVIALTTLPADVDAAAFAEALVGERLAACVSISAPMTSVYTWRGAVERAEERQLIIKTVRGNVPRLKTRLGSMHPYEVPELLVLAAADGGEAYLAWVRESTAG